MNSLQRVLKWLKFNKRRSRKSIKNEVFEIPYESAKTTSITIPDVQNKTFKISKWFVSIGQIIQNGQIICELESNSIALEFESFTSGRLVHLSKAKGELKANDLICKIEEV